MNLTYGLPDHSPHIKYRVVENGTAVELYVTETITGSYIVAPAQVDIVFIDGQVASVRNHYS